jgi:pimeloyl-ACP methyl ester carboxylesterase
MLNEAGHTAYTPTLTGVGERAHLGKLDVNLELHIQDILMVLEYENLHDVTLVGHSYGGMVVAGVADRAAEKLAQVIYIDAFVPGNNQSMLDLLPPQVRAGFERMAQEIGGRLMMPPLPYASVGRIGEGGLPESEVRRLLDRRLPQPLDTYTQPVQLTNPGAATLSHTYILCTDKDPNDPFVHFARRAQAAGWRYNELESGHFPMLTMPRELARLLSQLV